MGGTLLGKEQTPHAVDEEGLTPCPTLLCKRKAVRKPKHNG